MKTKEFQETKGITIIALVVSIIVMLILAGVTIITLTGDNRNNHKNIRSKGFKCKSPSIRASTTSIYGFMHESIIKYNNSRYNSFRHY